MIERKMRGGGTRKLRPAFIHSPPDAQGNMKSPQITAELVEDLRNVTESLLRETRKVRHLLEQAARERKAAQP